MCWSALSQHHKYTVCCTNSINQSNGIFYYTTKQHSNKDYQKISQKILFLVAVVVEFYKLACNRISSYSSLYCAVVRFFFLPFLPLLYFFPSFLGERIVFFSLLGQFAQNGVYKVLAAQTKLLMTVIWREK